VKAFRTYTVAPKLPEGLEGLRQIAYNLWWCWNPDAIELLRRIDRDLWEQHYHNPIAVFGAVPQERWQQLAEDESFRQHLERVLAALNDYMGSETWFSRNYPHAKNGTIAYFSFEYGLSEAIKIYAGGLGVLAGDHLKAASDMGVPICGIGLLYQVGYFTQYLNADGWQQESYAENDFHTIPAQPVTGPDGAQLRVAIPTDGHDVTALIWRVNVGRVPLYLLDTNTPENPPEDRAISYQLYGGDVLSWPSNASINGCVRTSSRSSRPAKWCRPEPSSRRIRRSRPGSTTSRRRWSPSISLLTARSWASPNRRCSNWAGCSPKTPTSLSPWPFWLCGCRI